MDSETDISYRPLSWEIRKKKAMLKGGDETTLRFKWVKKRAIIKIGEHQYSIRNKGFWNATTLIEKDGKFVARLKRVLNSGHAVIEFENETRYYLRLKNPVFVKLSIYALHQKEIVRYKLVSRLKATFNVNTAITQTNDNELLLLVALGYFIFSGVLKENKIKIPTSLVYSNPVSRKKADT